MRGKLTVALLLFCSISMTQRGYSQASPSATWAAQAASAFTPESAGLDRQCAGPIPVPRSAAGVNWYGVTHVADVIDGPNREEIARRLSPLTYVRSGLPPVLTIHAKNGLGSK